MSGATSNFGRYNSILVDDDSIAKHSPRNSYAEIYPLLRFYSSNFDLLLTCKGCFVESNCTGKFMKHLKDIVISGVGEVGSLLSHGLKMVTMSQLLMKMLIALNAFPKLLRQRWSRIFCYAHVLSEARIDSCDVMIAATSLDEINLLSEPLVSSSAQEKSSLVSIIEITAPAISLTMQKALELTTSFILRTYGPFDLPHINRSRRYGDSKFRCDQIELHPPD